MKKSNINNIEEDFNIDNTHQEYELSELHKEYIREYIYILFIYNLFIIYRTFNNPLFVSTKDLIKRIRYRDIEHVNYFDPKLKKKKQANKEMIKYKNNTNSKYIFKLKFITDKDYDILGPIDAIKYDRRGFFEIFWFFLKKNNILLNLFFSRSLMEPLWIKIILFYLELTLMLALSAFFFSDDYIDSRAGLPEEVRVK